MAVHQSFYRRYRSQRFDEVLGQDHVTTALRNAVREGRVGQGYLFSGPRGTGKTSTARILAKVLNCEHPVDGEPDTTCDNCVAVQQGRGVDWLHELDAASNNGVDAMRDLIGRTGMGTSGARKVYILDEVHMLTQAASNALLKTLEEPPDHVIFVLATTEPEKVLPTIRSRTQHFEFHLLPADVLAAHVRHVIGDAGLTLGEDAVEHVVKMGRGSARDTLSALDQVAAAGGVLVDAVSTDDIVDALAARDAGAALVAVDAAIRAGREPRMLGVALVETMRHAFLAAMGAPAGGLPDQAEARAQAVSRAIGPAGLTRALEAIGTALIDMRQAPDARVPLEVALIQIARPEIGGDLDAIVRRVEALEQAVASGTPIPAAAAPAPAPPASTTTPDRVPGETPAAGAPRGDGARQTESAARGADAARARLAARDAPSTPPPADVPGPAGSRPTLGGVRKARDDAPPAAQPVPSETQPVPSETQPVPSETQPAPGATEARPAPSSTQQPAASDATPAEGSTVAAPPRGGAASGAAAPADLGALVTAWDGEIMDTLKGRAKALFKAGSFVAIDGSLVRFEVPNEHFLKNCTDKLDEVQTALSAHFGTPLRVALSVVAGGGAATAPDGESATTPAEQDPDDRSDEAVDIAELTDAPDATTGGVAKLKDAFPGAELLED